MFERVYPAARPARVAIPVHVVASIVIHTVALIAAVVTLPVYVNEQVADGIVFFAPLPVRRAEPSVERITYVEAASGGIEGLAIGAETGFIDGPAAPEGRGGVDLEDGSGSAGFAAIAEVPQVNLDSVYFPDEVDNPAAYDPRSAAPGYPDSLQSAGIEGAVTAMFTVDTTGRVAYASFEILSATHPRFAQAVAEALPFMLFKPAEISGVKIRQLVQQTFTFRIPGKQQESRDSSAAGAVPTPVPPPDPSPTGDPLQPEGRKGLPSSPSNGPPPAIVAP